MKNLAAAFARRALRAQAATGTVTPEPLTPAVEAGHADVERRGRARRDAARQAQTREEKTSA